MQRNKPVINIEILRLLLQQLSSYPTGEWRSTLVKSTINYNNWLSWHGFPSQW